VARASPPPRPIPRRQRRPLRRWWSTGRPRRTSQLRQRRQQWRQQPKRQPWRWRAIVPIRPRRPRTTSAAARPGWWWRGSRRGRARARRGRSWGALGLPTRLASKHAADTRRICCSHIAYMECSLLLLEPQLGHMLYANSI
jgi:hypothetical protein